MRYTVEECEDDPSALQVALDLMSEEGWRVTSIIRIPKRQHEELNAQYVIVFERED